MVTSQSGPVTGSAAGNGWRAGDWWSAAFRLALLLALLAGAASIVGSMQPSHRPESDLTRDIAAGRVTYLDYEVSGHEVRWVTGWWRWHETTLVTWDTGADQTANGDPALDWLNRQVDASGHFIPVQVRTGQDSKWGSSGFSVGV